MLNITRKDKIRNEMIRSKTKVKDVVTTAESAKGRWAGHIAKMNTRMWARRTTEWTPREGERARWRDDIEEKSGNNWRQVA